MSADLVNKRSKLVTAEILNLFSTVEHFDLLKLILKLTGGVPDLKVSPPRLTTVLISKNKKIRFEK